MNPARDRTLQKLRVALKERLPMPYPELKDDLGIYPPPNEEDLALLFAQQLQKQGGHFIFAASWEEAIDQLDLLFMQNQWPQPYCIQPKLTKILDLFGFPSLEPESEQLNFEVVLHTCEALIARTGSVLLSSAKQHGRKLSILAQTEIVLATSDQLVLGLEQALTKVHSRYIKETWPSMLSLVTGPSRTADIEKTLVMGAHGPQALYVFVIEP